MPCKELTRFLGPTDDLDYSFESCFGILHRRVDFITPHGKLARHYSVVFRVIDGENFGPAGLSLLLRPAVMPSLPRPL